MTLNETDRLIRGLRDLIKASGSAVVGTASGLAQTYADRCNEANRRLEQCATMLDQGDEQQAIQLAETRPPVLDLLTLLSFDKAHEWREFCQANHLPIAANFDGRIVHRLNAVYARGITLNHPLYRDYRAQIMKNRVTDAAVTLRSIVRLNPSDQNARQELERLEEKLLGRDLEQLSTLVAAGDERGTVALVDQLEEQRFVGNVKPQGAAWERGLALRREQFKREALAEARTTLAQVAPLQAAGKWQAAGPMLGHIKDLQAEHGFVLDGDEARRLAEFQSWVARGQKELSQQQAFQQSLNELEDVIERGEQRQAAAGVSGLPALRAELAVLVAQWRRVEEFERPIPEGFEPRYRKRAGLSRAEIDRLEKSRRNFWIAGSAAAALTCAVVIFLFVQHNRSLDLAGQLHHLVAARQVSATEKLLADARAKDAKLFDNADVKAAAAAADTFVESQHARQKEFDERMTALGALAAEQPVPFASRPPDAIQALLADAEKRKDALAPEYQAASDAPMAAFRNRWDAFLTHAGATGSEHYAAAIEDVEKQAGDELNYRRSPEELRQSLARISAKLQPLAAQAQQPPLDALKVRDDLVTRTEGVESTVTAFTKELGKFDASLKAMGDAATLDAYLQALRVGQESEFRGSRELAPAKRVLAINPTTDGLLAATLMPGDPEGWAFAKSNPNTGLMPTSAVLNPERHIYDQLLVDSNIRNVYLYQFHDFLSKKVSPLYSRGALDASIINGAKFASNPKGSFYQPDLFPNVLNFEETSLQGNASDERIAPDSQAFGDLRFRDLIDTAADRFAPDQGAPLHEFLDRLTRNTKATSLFKAFVFSRVYQMMQVGRRSGFWGLPFTPALAVHAGQIERIGAPASGYWMVPDEVKRKTTAFGQLFAAAAKVSYAQQARVLQAATREVGAAGLTFRGFADVSGQPQLIGHEADSGGPQPDLWGWTVRDGQPARLFAWAPKERQYKQVLEPAPLTPLLTPESDPAAILQATCKKLGLTGEETANSITPFLPPMLQGSGRTE
jgi:hypothetical protein